MLLCVSVYIMHVIFCSLYIHSLALEPRSHLEVKCWRSNVRGQMLEVKCWSWCFRSLHISHSLWRILKKLAQMLSSLRRCVEGMNWPFWLKVKVILFNILETSLSYLGTLILALGSVQNLNIKPFCASFCSSGT